MKKERLKIVRRIGMPETNSSSSHSVSISMNPESLIAPGDKEWDIEITEDGILKIPEGEDFGWDYFKTNSILTKLQYLYGAYCRGFDIRTTYGKKAITRLKKILKQIFGVKDVEFEWITKFSERLKVAENPEDIYFGGPEIDHNSYDIFEEITENINVIRAFLLSRDSWLYGGNDNSSAPEGFYNEKLISTSSLDAIISVELGGKIGRIDWEVRNLFNNIEYRSLNGALIYNDEFNILNTILYDINKKDWSEINYKDSTKFILDSKLSCFLQAPFIYIEGHYHILFTSQNFESDWAKRKTELSKSGIVDPEKITLEIMEKTKRGEDYISFPVKIKLLNYGNYEF